MAGWVLEQTYGIMNIPNEQVINDNNSNGTIVFLILQQLRKHRSKGMKSCRIRPVLCFSRVWDGKGEMIAVKLLACPQSRREEQFINGICNHSALLR